MLKDAEDYLYNRVRTPKPFSSEEVDTDNLPASSTTLPAAVQQSASLKPVVIYADGACAGNPGPGGYGVVLIHGIQRKELAAGFRLTTNNRIYSDSKYVVNTMTKSWALKWR